MSEPVPTAESLRAKLSPLVFPNVSGLLIAVVAFVIGAEWTEPRLAALSVTTDGHVVATDDDMRSVYVAPMTEVERNVRGMLDASDCDAGERDLFWRLWRDRVEDWRVNTGAENPLFDMPGEEM
jgi:hypothetical protein